MLDTLCHEADQALGADVSGVYLGNAEGGVAVAAHGIDDRLRLVGLPRSAPARAWAGKRASHRRARDHERLPRGPHPEHRCDAGRGLGGGTADARNGELRRALSVGFFTMPAR